MQADSPSPGGVEQQGDRRQPRSGRPAQVTTIRKAILIGALVALVGGASSLATARLMDRQSDSAAQQAEIAQLTSQVSEQKAELAQLTSQAVEGADEVDRLAAAVAAQEQRALAAEVQVGALEAEKASLEEQLSEVLNPAPGPTPTALLTARWVMGTRDVVVCVEIENASDGDTSISYSYAQFSAIDLDDFVYPPRLHTPGYGIQLLTPLMSGELGPGEKRRGELLYAVPTQVLKKLVWNAGFGDTPEMAVDLSGGQGTTYNPYADPC
jgi:hypothetical protein